MVKPRRGEPRSAARRDGNLHVSARALLDSVPDAVVGVDREGRIAFVNAQTENLLSYERREMLGQPVELLLPDHLKGAHARHREVYHANPTTRPMGVGLDLVARRKDGSELPVEISLSPLQADDAMLVIAVIRDVTERRETLHREHAAREQAEEALCVRAAAEGLRDDLSNMVVHDLKNPLNGVSMMVQLALRKGGYQLPESQRHYLRQIDRSCQEMMRLVLNLLEISKIEAGKMPVACEPISVAAVADEVVEEYAPAAEQVGRRLVVTVAPNLQAMGDRELLKRVLVNLIVNGLRHSGSPEIRLEAVAVSDGPEVTIRVVDVGRGIPLDEQPRMFEKFRSQRGDPTMDTGLGLPFCKLAVERMGGRIALTSAPGAGTTFAVTLPTVPRPS